MEENGLYLALINQGRKMVEYLTLKNWSFFQTMAVCLTACAFAFKTCVNSMQILRLNHYFCAIFQPCDSGLLRIKSATAYSCSANLCINTSSIFNSCMAFIMQYIHWSRSFSPMLKGRCLRRKKGWP